MQFKVELSRRKVVIIYALFLIRNKIIYYFIDLQIHY